MTVGPELALASAWGSKKAQTCRPLRPNPLPCLLVCPFPCLPEKPLVSLPFRRELVDELGLLQDSLLDQEFHQGVRRRETEDQKFLQRYFFLFTYGFHSAS